MNTNAITITHPTEHAAWSAEQRDLIRTVFANGASDAEFAALVAVAEARNLNPFTRQVFFVKRWDSAKRCETWAVQVSIDGLRAIAERTGLYAGQDEPEYEHDEKGAITLCKVRVYRKDWGNRACVGVAYWSEYVQCTKEGRPTSMWQKFAHVMIAKCAEALALRKAFPEVASGLYTGDEMDSPETIPAHVKQSATQPALHAASMEQAPVVDATIDPPQQPAPAQQPAAQPASESPPTIAQWREWIANAKDSAELDAIRADLPREMAAQLRVEICGRLCAFAKTLEALQNLRPLLDKITDDKARAKCVVVYEARMNELDPPKDDGPKGSKRKPNVRSVDANGSASNAPPPDLNNPVVALAVLHKCAAPQHAVSHYAKYHAAKPAKAREAIRNALIGMLTDRWPTYSGGREGAESIVQRAEESSIARAA